MTAQHVEPKPISREQAEHLITHWLLVQVARSDYRTVCEMFTREPCRWCIGLNAWTDTELRERYRPYIADIDKLSGEALFEALFRFERDQMDAEHQVSCAVMAETGRLCDGLAKFTNEELPRRFPDVLKGRVVVD